MYEINDTHGDVMRVPASERTVAIRAKYTARGFTGPEETDRERDAVIGYLLDELGKDESQGDPGWASTLPIVWILVLTMGVGALLHPLIRWPWSILVGICIGIGSASSIYALSRNESER